MTEPQDAYDKILAKPITEEYNVIDKAKELLETLLDDENVGICDMSGTVIQCAIDLLD